MGFKDHQPQYINTYLECTLPYFNQEHYFSATRLHPLSLTERLPIAISLQSPLARLSMVHNMNQIMPADLHTAGPLDLGRHGPRLWTKASGTPASSGSHLRTYLLCGSCFRLWLCGLKMRIYGAASGPDPADDRQPPLFAAGSQSTRLFMNQAAPQRQSISKFFVRNEVVTMRARLCIQPVCTSWRMPASTSG